MQCEMRVQLLWVLLFVALSAVQLCLHTATHARNPQVAGLERQPRVGHDRGSSHGHSRIIRLAYFEGTQYGPLLVRSAPVPYCMRHEYCMCTWFCHNCRLLFRTPR